ncbi:uncharacterized protein LOC122094196 [Macadamia integrifolia]|uniref:uncharacterized protein LOC122094196 n=1 Tax=Macadamia integrifolia TaxID=60698 RepID=UPI001C529E53|nr:uncharacterized protein LOC122094196 [Macadamia integrifolia]
MANPLLPWNSRREMSSTDCDGKSLSNKKQERGHETLKPRVRKNAKSSASGPKKPPQRGLGVAQLERLRLQESWKKIIEFENSQRGPRKVDDHQLPFPFADHQNGVFVPYSKSDHFNIGGFTSDDGHANSQLPSHLHPYKLPNGSVSATAGTPAGVRSSMFSDQFLMDVMRVTAQEPRFQSGNLHLYETNKELSSTQTMHCWSDQCDVSKKKQIHGGNLGSNYNVESRKYETMLSIGLNLGTDGPINGEQKQDIGVDVNPATFSAPGVHKGMAVEGRSILMEYQFSPEKVDPSSVHHISNTCNNGACGCSSYIDIFHTGVAAVGEASVTTNSLDLSLKLSI